MARLLDVLPSDTGMAFILVQHLDPSHESLLVELLAPHTRMAVSEAAEGMLVEPDRVYVCPPGHFLAVRFGTLHLSLPHPDHGARLPIDSIDRAIAKGSTRQTQDKASRETAARLATLTVRQKTVLDLVLAGHPSKNIAVDLGISQRTIETHRAEIMYKLGVRTIPDLVRLVLSAPAG